MRKARNPALCSPDELAHAWRERLKLVEQEAFRTYSSRAIFQDVQQMFNTNEQLRNDGYNVYRWLFRMFYTDGLLSVRRELEKGGGALSLMNLLFEIEQHSEGVLTRARYIGDLPVHHPFRTSGMAEELFEGRTGAMCRWPRMAPSEDCISGASVERRRKDLSRRTSKVERFAHLFLAHRTPTDNFTITLADLYAATDLIFDVYEIYHILLGGGSWAFRTPAPQYDHLAAFRIPWITESFVPSDTV